MDSSQQLGVSENIPLHYWMVKGLQHLYSSHLVFRGNNSAVSSWPGCSCLLEFTASWVPPRCIVILAFVSKRPEKMGLLLVNHPAHACLPCYRISASLLLEWWIPQQQHILQVKHTNTIAAVGPTRHWIVSLTSSRCQAIEAVSIIVVSGPCKIVECLK